MGWEKYRKTAKHNFKDFGCPGFWVELLRLDAKLYGESDDASDELDEKTLAKLKVLLAKGLADDDAAVQLALEDEEAAQKIVDLSEKQLAKNVVNWNLTHPKTNEDLPVPTEDDTSSFRALPREFVVQMHLWLREDSELAKQVPKGKGT